MELDTNSNEMENNIVTTKNRMIVNHPKKTPLAGQAAEHVLTTGERNVGKGSGKLIKVLLILFLSPVAMYYLWTRGFIYLNFSKEVYTDYFWFRAPWLLVHVIFGIMATLIGPFQFIPAIRRKNLVVHRLMGRIYIVSILISTLVSFYLVSTAQLGLVYVVGLACLGIVWLGTTTMGYLAIRKKKIQVHTDWMIKSYVLTVAFVNFRFIEDLMAMANIGDFAQRKVLMSWACWAIPFFVTEVVLQVRKLYLKNSSEEQLKLRSHF